jgi:hypothetical protein
MIFATISALQKAGYFAGRHLWGKSVYPTRAIWKLSSAPTRRQNGKGSTKWPLRVHLRNSLHGGCYAQIEEVFRMEH